MAAGAFINHLLTITEAVMLWYSKMESTFAAAFVLAAILTFWLL